MCPGGTGDAEHDEAEPRSKPAVSWISSLLGLCLQTSLPTKRRWGESSPLYPEPFLAPKQRFRADTVLLPEVTNMSTGPAVPRRLREHTHRPVLQNAAGNPGWWMDLCTFGVIWCPARPPAPLPSQVMDTPARHKPLWCWVAQGKVLQGLGGVLSKCFLVEKSDLGFPNPQSSYYAKLILSTSLGRAPSHGCAGHVLPRSHRFGGFLAHGSLWGTCACLVFNAGPLSIPPLLLETASSCPDAFLSCMAERGLNLYNQALLQKALMKQSCWRVETQRVNNNSCNLKQIVRPL